MMNIFERFAEIIAEVVLPLPVQPLYDEKTAREIVEHIERQGVKVIEMRK